MRRADAPPPGWYPEPTGASGLRWWDGLDWTDHRRPPPASGTALAAGPAEVVRDGGWAPHDDPLLTQSQLRTRRAAERALEADAAAVVAEARRAAREEVDRAVRRATGQFEEARSRYLPRLEQYRARLRRWSRLVAVAVVLVVALSAWLNATASVGLLEWLGERIDGATGTIVLVDDWPPG